MTMKLSFLFSVVTLICSSTTSQGPAVVNAHVRGANTPSTKMEESSQRMSSSTSTTSTSTSSTSKETATTVAHRTRLLHRPKQHYHQRGLVVEDESEKRAKTKNSIFNMVAPGSGNTGMSMPMSGSSSVAGSSGGSGGSGGPGASGGAGGGGMSGAGSGGGVSVGVGVGCTSTRDCNDDTITGGNTDDSTTGAGGDDDGGPISSSGGGTGSDTPSPITTLAPVSTPLPTIATTTATVAPVVVGVTTTPAPNNNNANPTSTLMTLPPFPLSNTNECPNSYSATFHAQIEGDEDTKFCTSNADCADFFATGLRVACCLFPQCLCGPFMRQVQCVPN